MKRLAAGMVVAGLLAGLSAGGAAAQTTGGQTGGTGQLGVRTLGNGKTATTPPAAGSNAGNVSQSPIIGAGATGNGGIMTGTTGTAPAAGTPAPSGAKLDGIASGKAP